MVRYLKYRDCGCESDTTNQTRIYFCRDKTTVELDLCNDCYEKRAYELYDGEE